MGERQQQPHVVVPPEVVIAKEVKAQLEESQKVRDDAEIKVQQAEATASEMSKILRRIAAAMDENPQSWDALFGRGRR